MAKIGVLIENMFEDSEYGKPAAAFKKANHQLVHLGIKKGIVKGLKTGMKVKVEKSVSDVADRDLDAIFIPGGYSPDRLRGDDAVVAFVKRFGATGKPIFFICHGAQLLISANLLKGRRATGWKSIKQDIKNAGASFLDQKVVEDKNFVSSRSPEDIPAFIVTCLKQLKKSNEGG